MRAAVNALLRNDWVIGIASAIAIGYAVVSLGRSLAMLALSAAAERDHSGPLTVWGIHYGGVLSSAITLVAVVAAAALALARSGRPD